MSFDEQLKRRSAEVQSALDPLLAQFGSDTVSEGMRYATRGGKRLRGFLVMEGAALFDVPPEQSRWAAAAIECIHAYSLVHDDLPCMDDDDLRRGQPTVHKKWDEATAVLVGDALQTIAFEVLADPRTSAAPDVRLTLVKTLAQASGAAGMVLGQAQDIAAETAGLPLGLDAITELQANKTGALICWSAEAGAILAEEDPAPLRSYAKALGLAFQIADDILDVEGDEAKTGKRVGKDEDAGKATFVSHLGLDGAKKKARELVADAIDALSLYSAQADYLRDAAHFVVSRDT
ncbi:MAG: farnesyl diphosphate synthase [Pseudomonadota bacterium]